MQTRRPIRHKRACSGCTPVHLREPLEVCQSHILKTTGLVPQVPLRCQSLQFQSQQLLPCECGKEEKVGQGGGKRRRTNGKTQVPASKPSSFMFVENPGGGGPQTPFTSIWPQGPGRPQRRAAHFLCPWGACLFLPHPSHSPLVAVFHPSLPSLPRLLHPHPPSPTQPSPSLGKNLNNTWRRGSGVLRGLAPTNTQMVNPWAILGFPFFPLPSISPRCSHSWVSSQDHGSPDTHPLQKKWQVDLAGS